MQLKNTKSMNANTLPAGRRKLAAVLRAAGDVVTTDDVVAALAIERTKASKLLSRWAEQGWLRRVGRGTYAPASLDSLESEHVLADPWVLVPALYAPAYIGGHTAAAHWDLTEQLFRDIVVMTVRPVRRSREKRHGAEFTLHHIQEQHMFGTKSVWRGQSKVPVSDIHRTLVDMLSSPVVGGGIQHVADCFDAYVARPDKDAGLLVEYADRLGNGAVFKRLGFLAERHPSLSALSEVCRTRLTQGNARLDGMLDCSRLVSRWRLWVPPTWIAEDGHD